MKSPYIVMALIPFIFFKSQSAYAQRSAEEFYAKLHEMYKYTVPLIKPSELQTKGAENFVLLDAREKKEYEVSKLPGAVYVGYNKFESEAIADIPKDRPIVVYCSVGYRSERIGEKLKKMGYTQVYNLYGGIFEWKSTDQEVVDKDNKPTEKVHAYNKDWGQWLRKGTKVY